MSEAILPQRELRYTLMVVVENAGKLDLTEIKAGSTFHDEMADNLRLIARLLPNEIGMRTVIYSGHRASASGGIPVEPF